MKDSDLDGNAAAERKYARESAKRNEDDARLRPIAIEQLTEELLEGKKIRFNGVDWGLQDVFDDTEGFPTMADVVTARDLYVANHVAIEARIGARRAVDAWLTNDRKVGSDLVEQRVEELREES